MPIDLSPHLLHAGNDLLVIDKPTGVSLLADRAGEPCLWEAIVAWCARERDQQHYPRPVHRLDKGTSGVLVVALSDEAQRSLNRQFAARDVGKNYLAITAGIPTPARAFIDLPLRPGRKNRYRIAGPRDAIVLNASQYPPRWELKPGTEEPDRASYSSQSYYRVIAASPSRALVMVHPLTGRTHQIRVHFAWLGWPLLGDHLYGKPSDPAQQAPRLALHCHRVAFLRDWGNEPPRMMSFKAPVPNSFSELQ